MAPRDTTTIEVTPEAATKLMELRAHKLKRAFLRAHVAGRACCASQYALAFEEKSDETGAMVEWATPSRDGAPASFVARVERPRRSVRHPELSPVRAYAIHASGVDLHIPSDVVMMAARTYWTKSPTVRRGAPRSRARLWSGPPPEERMRDVELMDAIEHEYWDRGERDFRAYAKAYAHDDGVIWDTAVAVLLRLQEATGVRLHLLHTQTKRVVEMLRAAKAAGRTVSAEVNPWCFWLGNDWANIERLGSYALSYFVAPHHSDAVYAGFRDGTVDIMATDRAPHLREDKEPGWKDGWKAHTGTPSEQFYLSLLLTDVNDGKIGLERVADATATRPAKLFGLYPRKGAIRVGADADIVLVDLAEQRTIRDEDVLSKCGWTPYAGREVRGAARYTFLRGQAIYDDGKIAVREGMGRQAMRTQSAAAVGAAI
jgi:hypothetical protein